MEREIHIYPTSSELIHAVAGKIVGAIQQAVQHNGTCSIALVGGNTPREVYALLATMPYQSRVNWNYVYLFWGDERTVPPNHPESNFGMVQRTLLAHIPIPKANVHRMLGELTPHLAAAEYTAALRRLFKQNLPRFDLILLGLGQDGHTASLFPGTDALEEKDQPAVAVLDPALNTYRVTLTFPVINAAREVVFLVSGRNKAAIVQRVMGVKYPTKELPATMVQPDHGVLHWMLDAEAAELIQEINK
jgi:6-phosphogluconolactonase